MRDPNHIYTAEEAGAHLDAFHKELAALLERYGMHSIIGVVTVLTGADQHSIHYGSLICGCNICMTKSLAKVIVDYLTRTDLDAFLAAFAHFTHLKIGSPADREEEQLANLPVALDPTGKPWKQ